MSIVNGPTKSNKVGPKFNCFHLILTIVIENETHYMIMSENNFHEEIKFVYGEELKSIQFCVFFFFFFFLRLLIAQNIVLSTFYNFNLAVCCLCLYII